MNKNANIHNPETPAQTEKHVQSNLWECFMKAIIPGCLKTSLELIPDWLATIKEAFRDKKIIEPGLPCK